MSIVYVSLAVNVLVAGFWGFVLGFAPQANLRRMPYGADSPGTRILASLYLAITFFSVVAFFKADWRIPLCIFLFSFQIVYKVLSAITVRDLKNPVVLSNLAIALLHSFTLYWLLRHAEVFA